MAVVIECKNVSEDYLDEFCRDIRENLFERTESVLRSTEVALNIQHVADMEV